MNTANRNQAIINLDNLIWNVNELMSCLPKGVGLIPVIKADAYGHGAVVFAKELEGLSRCFAVAGIDEALELRNSGCTKDILILGHTHPLNFEAMLLSNVMPTIDTLDMAEELSEVAARLGITAKIHIKVDTGMNRLGVSCNAAGLQLVSNIAKLPYVEIAGILTHYAKADEADKTAAKVQLEKFRNFVEDLEKMNIHIPCKHIANSAGAMEMDNTGFNRARLGIAMYGLYPSNEVDKEKVKLKPVMELTSHVVNVHDLRAGESVGYGGTFTAERDMRIAVISIGYADGYPRAMSNRGRVIIRGQYANILGRVCMDQIMVDVTHIPEVAVFDEAVLVGSRQGKTITVEEIADNSMSFNYEFVCGISRRVPRIYVRNGEVVDVVNYLL